MATNMDQSNNLVIGNGVTFKGTLNVPKKATIYGTVDGELTAEEIFIGQSGKITGKVTARSIEVEGELHQVIHCRDHLHIRATGKVSGKLEYSRTALLLRWFSALVSSIYIILHVEHVLNYIISSESLFVIKIYRWGKTDFAIQYHLI